MKKVKNIFSSACKVIKSQKCAAGFSAAVFALTSVTCMFQFATDTSASANSGNSNVSSKEILQLSESYLAQSPDMTASTVLIVSDRFNTINEEESEPEQMLRQLSAESESEEADSSEETEKTEFSFEELGLTQMSDIEVPDDILFDENGIPLEYSYKVTGRATAYSMGTTTATGTSVHEGVVAVNPRNIPYGSTMYIVASDGTVYGYSSAEDTGSFIYWDNAPVVDLYVNSKSAAYAWGNREVTMYIF
ncbi:MAG: 3D domain-containing protein [Clostridia bacterium]|nr:3D domain-containing protein [Clostridia bacterium]